MTLNKTTKVAPGDQGWLRRLAMFLTEPHPSVQEVEEKTRAQLLAILTLILSILYIFAIFSGPKSYTDFVVLLLLTALAYLFSPTRYYRIGIYIFCFGFTAFAYATLFLGTATGYTSAITTSVHVSLVVASILLSARSLAALVLFVTLASATAPLYSQVPIALDSNYYKDTGVAVAIGLILIGAPLFGQGNSENVRGLNGRVLQFQAALQSANANERAGIQAQAAATFGQRASALASLIRQDPGSAEADDT